MIVNLNTLCKVRLNDNGKKIWMSQIDELPEEVKTEHPEVVANIKNKIDADGYVELELWAIMNVFGYYMSPLTNPFATDTIQISKNPNFGNHFQVDETK